MLQWVLSWLRHHARSLRILNGFSFRWYCRTINAQGVRPHVARSDGIQGQDVLETLALFTGLSMMAVSCASLSSFLAVSSLPGPAVVITSLLMEPLVEFGGEVESAPGEVERVKGALTATESVREVVVEMEV